MSLDLEAKEEFDSLWCQVELARKQPEEETHFLPPCMEGEYYKGR